MIKAFAVTIDHNIQGLGSRCSRSGSKPRCYRSGRTTRGCGSGCSYHPRATRRRKRCSCSCRLQQGPKPHRHGRETPCYLFMCSISAEKNIRGKNGIFTPLDASRQFTPAASTTPKVFLGVGSRCPRPGTKPRRYRPGRTTRSCGSGCSDHPRTKLS